MNAQLEPQYDTPHSIESEQSVLGALMLGEGVLNRVSGILEASDFFRADHREIYQAIQAVALAGDPTDALTVGARLDPELAAYLLELQLTQTGAGNVEAHARMVRDKAALRLQVDVGTAIINEARKANGSAGEVYGRNVAALAAILPRITPDTDEPLDLWGDYVPTPIRREYLPPLLAKVSFDLSEVMGAAPEIFALTGIAAASGACHDAFRLQPKPTEPLWTERACLWTMIVADPGSKKTPAMKRMLAPLLEINAGLVREYVGKQAEFEDADRLAKMTRREIEKRKAKGAAGETVGLDEDVEVPDRPEQRRVMIADATIEKAADLMADNPRGMMLYRDELSGWFGSMDAYSKTAAAKDRPIWLESYNGGPMPIDRIGRGTLLVENWSMSVIGSTQPEKIRALMWKADDDGLFQRFMMIEVPNGYRPEAEREPDHAAYRQYCDVIREIWNRVPTGGNTVLSLDPGADKIRRELFDWVTRVSSSEGLPSMLRGHLSKWTGLWCRLVVAYHCFGCAAGGLWPGSQPVAESTAHRVTALMKRYLLPQALRFYNDTGVDSDPVYKMARTAASFILSTNAGRLTSRDMQQNCRTWRSATPWQRDAVIRQLTESRWLLATDGKRQRGEGVSAWAVNQRVHTLYEERAAAERTRRSMVAQGLAELRGATVEEKGAH